MNLPTNRINTESANSEIFRDVGSSDRKRIKLDCNKEGNWSLQENDEKSEVLAEIGLSILETENASDTSANSNSRCKQQVITNYFQTQQDSKKRKIATPIKKSSISQENVTNSICGIEKENDYDFLNTTNPLMVIPDHFHLHEEIQNKSTKSKNSTKKRNRAATLALKSSEQKRKLSDPENSENFSMQSPSSAVGRSPLSDLYNNSINRTSNTREIQNIQEFYIYRKRDNFTQLSDVFFNRLSDEMVLSIFKWLPKKTLVRCSLVCKRWYRISQDESLWTRLDLGSKILPNGCVGKVLSRGTIILRMAQTEVADLAFAPSCLSMAADFQSKVQYLDLSMSVINLKTLHDILSKCRLLKKLSLEHVKVNDDICKQIAENNGLEVLNLCMSEGITMRGVKSIMDGCKQLQALNISWTCLSYEAVQYLCDNLQQCLTRLNIAGNRKTLTDKMVETLVQHCSCLIDLDLSDCTLLTEATVHTLMELTTLEHLCLSRCYNIKPTAYIVMHRYSSLMYLDIFGLMSEQAITMLSSQLPQVGINKFLHSSVARPTVGTRRTSVWGLRTRD